MCGFRLLQVRFFFPTMALEIEIESIEEAKKSSPIIFVHLEGFSLISLRVVEI